MAATDPSKANAPEAEVINDEAMTVRRRVKAEPETIRSRNLKLQEGRAIDPGRSPLRAFLWGLGWPLRKLGQGIASLERFKVFRVIGHILVPSYFRNSWRELRLVTWPNRRQSWSLTYAVIVFSVLFGAIIAVVDFGLDKLFKEIILK